VGLLACGSLVASLGVLRALAPDAAPGGISSSRDAIKRDPEASALLAFALSDDYDDLIRSLSPERAALV
jgi:hypothetical protein